MLFLGCLFIGIVIGYPLGLLMLVFWEGPIFRFLDRIADRWGVP